MDNKIVFSSGVASKLSQEELDELRDKAVAETEIETEIGKVVVVERVFAGQGVLFVAFPEEVDNSGIKVSVSPAAEKLPKNVLEEMVGHTVATTANKQVDQVALKQLYDTDYGHFQTFALFDPAGGTPVVYVGQAGEIALVEKDFKDRAKHYGQSVKTYSSPKSRAMARKRVAKAQKKLRKTQ